MVKFKTKASVNESLSRFSSIYKEHDFIDVTEWANEDGWDITLSSGGSEQIISLHTSELEAINYMVNQLRYREDEENED